MSGFYMAENKGDCEGRVDPSLNSIPSKEGCRPRLPQKESRAVMQLLQLRWGSMECLHAGIWHEWGILE